MTLLSSALSNTIPGRMSPQPTYLVTRPVVGGTTPAHQNKIWTGEQ